MSILIKNAQLPSGCDRCRFGEIYNLTVDGGDQFVCELDWSLDISIYDTDKRHKDCPLIEVPDREKGKWGAIHGYVGDIEVSMPYCSRCGMSPLGVGWEYKSKYCPNCGTEMEQE